MSNFPNWKHDSADIKQDIRYSDPDIKLVRVDAFAWYGFIPPTFNRVARKYCITKSEKQPNMGIETDNILLTVITEIPQPAIIAAIAHVQYRRTRDVEKMR